MPAAVVRHDYAAVIDRRFLTRHTLWHCAGWRASCASTPSACGVAASGRESDSGGTQLEADLRAEVAPVAIARVERVRLERRRDGDLGR